MTTWFLSHFYTHLQINYLSHSQYHEYKQYCYKYVYFTELQYRTNAELIKAINHDTFIAI